MIFEDENGEIENIFQDHVPYDLNAPVIEIRPEDYGIWYVDVMENPDLVPRKNRGIYGACTEAEKFSVQAVFPGKNGDDLLCG